MSFLMKPEVRHRLGAELRLQPLDPLGGFLQMHGQGFDVEILQPYPFTSPVMLKAGWWGAADLCGPGPAGRSSRSVQQVGDVAPRFDTAAAAGLQDAQSGGVGRRALLGAGASAGR